MEALKIEWITKEAAGVRLGTAERPLSTRRVLELAKEGRIQSKLDRDPVNGQMTTKIHAGSVERYLDERQPCEVREPRAPQSLNSQLALRSALPAGFARLWLTLGEAEGYSGLPASILLGMIQGGLLATLDVGIRRGGRWRVRRVDLDRIEGRLLTPIDSHQRISRNG